jgi:hypothetical protein
VTVKMKAEEKERVEGGKRMEPEKAIEKVKWKRERNVKAGRRRWIRGVEQPRTSRESVIV